MTGAVHFDVAVAGGGSAGIAAALASARTGARTLLIERAAELGGNVSQALVHTFCGVHLEQERALPANPGLPLEFVAGLRKCGGAAEPERVGRVWVVPVRPEAVAVYARNLVEAEAELECWTRARVVAARLATLSGEPSCLEVVRSEQPERVQEVLARIVVDTSGEGAIAALGGAEYDIAAPEDLQAISYIFGLDGVPAAALEGFEPMKLSLAVARASREGALPRECESLLIRPSQSAGEALVTLGVPALPGRAHAPLDEGYCEEMRARGRGLAERIVAHLQRERAGFELCRATRWPARAGVREGRRLRGLCTLEARDVLGGRRSDDEVALSCWPIELWDDHRRARFQHVAGACSVPLGCLASRSHPGLGMAGRCLSASHQALGALRVIGTALATGAAVGRAAALAAARGSALGEVPAREVRSAALGGDA